ncbi:hypothetical protein BU25DRAFT_465433 [Macroventuria anomochaeta]|uniref:Uncharacterized protein n=1 Tax=Macroventuria anomochaeta TaxID=301207 RepID=A0ACB6S6U9_9PLEO|nr:uncharacterized protein BU25DRAFT_465433 [Macroventuria anomochaeta]KAF2629290.1 hypothetical protein BU25DRAFT_465433 [Macroventuria anomochaeta]
MSSLLNAAAQLWHAVAGDGTQEEHANESNHATTPPRNLLPPSPFASQEPSPRQTNALIDLTSAESHSPIYEIDLLPKHTSSRLQHRPNNGERRKLSDATRVPDPAQGYQGPPAMKKPAAGKGYQPINTLNSNAIADRNNPAFGRKHTTTYGKHDRNTKLIGLQRDRGQQAFLERNPSHKSATSYSYSVPQASPLKRRKTEHPNVKHPHTVQEIDDSEEDEIQEVIPPASQASTPRARSIMSSRSPHSTASKQSGTGAKPASQPMSEFAQTNNLLNPKRAPSRRRKNVNATNKSRRGSQADVPFLGAGSLSQGQSANIADDDIKPPGTARKTILQSIEQGVKRNPSLIESQHSNERVTSKHFPTMRINESTAAETYDRITSGVSESGLTRNLREYRPAESHIPELKGDPIEGSEDELAQPNTSKSRRKQSPSTTSQMKHSAAARKNTIDKCYQLEYARSYGFGPDWAQFSMEHTENPRKFRISGLDLNGNSKVLKILDLASINRITSDNTHSMRITGPSVNGNMYWCDLKFPEFKDFIQFRDNYIIPEVACNAQSSVSNDRDQMEELFKRPLKKNDKIGTTPMVNEEVSSNQTQSGQRRTPRSRLITGMTSDPHTASDSNPDGLTKPPASTRAQARPARATRATASMHDQDILENGKEADKFSVRVGLGKRWPNQLDFNIEESFLKRRRCTVNFDDLPRLDEDEMLNDSLVNFYMLQSPRYLYNELKVSVDRVYFFNTYFFESLTKNTKGRDAINYDAVRSWTRRDDVFSYDHIVVPINEKYHWYLAIICNVSNIARKPAVDDLQEDSQDLDRPTTDVHTAGAKVDSNNDTIAEHQDEIAGKTLVTGGPLVQEILDNDDENLFEEEKKLSLIDRDEESVAESQQPTKKQDRSDEQQVQDQVASAALLSAQAEGTSSILLSSQSKQALKKKGKHRPTAPKKDPEKPVIMILDSLSGAHSNATRALREWLQAEGLEKRGMTVEIDNKGHYPKSAQIPMQNNFSDCGLYVLGYAKKFFADPDGFRKKLLTGEMSAETDWPDMDPSKMRSDLRNLIFRLYDAQKEAHKAKKAAKVRDARISPTKVGSKRTSPSAQQSSAVEADTSAIAQAATDGELSTVTATAKATTPPTVTLRLASPFAPEARTDKSHPHNVEDAKKDNVSHSPPTAISSPTTSTKTIPAEPKQAPVKRLSSPEVRVSTKSLHIDSSSYMRYDGAIDQPRRPTQQSTDLTSPLQKHGLRSKDDGKLRMPSSRKTQESSPSRPRRERPVPSSPSQPRTRSGSYDDPITLDDSQDLDAPVQQQPRSAKKPPPNVIELDRSQETIDAPICRAKAISKCPPAQRRTYRQTLQHDDSVQEGVGYEWQEGRDVTHALKTSLEDERRRLSEQVNNPLHDSDRPMENVYNAERVYSQSSHTMQEVPETQAMDVDDKVIKETPGRQRSSPGLDADPMDWQPMPVYNGR